MNAEKLCVGCMENDSGLPVCPTCGRPFDLPPRSPMQLKPRTLLRDQYLIGRALGDGGFGITYLAWDLGLETRLAIKEYIPNGVAARTGGETKVLTISEQTKPEFDWGLERFLEEARVLKKFSAHPGIVAVDTVFRDNGTAYLVMEFLDGVTFEEFLSRRGGRITYETAMRVILPSMDALAAVHAEGILHRDISPDNIYLTRSGKVKLIDFGAARNALSQKSRNLSIILKEGYAPEEQYRSSGIQGPWTDVYAVAATLYHAITGQIPQPALDRQAQDKLLWPSQLGVQMEPRSEAALMKALAIKANERFQSMEDFKSAITGSVFDFAGAPRSTQPVTPPPPPPPVSQSYTVAPTIPHAIPQSGQPLVLPTFAQAAPPPPPPPSYAPPPVQTQIPPSQTGAAPTAPPASSAKLLWLVIPAAAALICGVVLLIVLLPKFGLLNTLFKNTTSTVTSTVSSTAAVSSATSGDRAGGTTSDSNAASNSNDPKTTPVADPNAGAAQDATPSPTQPAGGNATSGDAGVAADGAVVGGARYDSLVRGGSDQFTAGNYDQAVDLLTQAVRLNSANPKAYAQLGEVYLYGVGNLPEALKDYHAAIAHGGTVVFHVHHDHGGGNFAAACDGRLHVSKSSISFVPLDSSHNFKVKRGDIKEAKKNRVMGLFSHGQVSLNAFHIKLADGKNYNFAPESSFTEAERDLILNILGKS